MPAVARARARGGVPTLRAMAHHRLLHAYAALRYRPRLLAAIALGLVLWALLRLRLPEGSALLWAFDAAAVLYLATTGWLMSRATPELLRLRAQRLQDGRWSVLVFSIGLAIAVVVALAQELRAAPGHVGPVALAGSSILLAWLFLGTQFALHYAHEDQLCRSAGEPALLFPGKQPPDYWDYFYFSMVLSMAFQTSDVSIADRRLRRLVLWHSMLAFVFNVGILALTINAIAGVLAK